MRRWWPLIVLLLMGMIWGLQFAMLKLAVERGRSELNVLLMALVLLSVIYAILVGLKGRRFRPTREHLVFFVIIAILGYILPMGATLYAAPYMPAGIITLLASLSPIATFAVAIGLRTEPVSRIRIWAMLLGCVSAAAGARSPGGASGLRCARLDAARADHPRVLRGGVHLRRCALAQGPGGAGAGMR